MKPRMRLPFPALFLLSLVVLAAPAAAASPAALERLADRLTGTFSNAEQAAGSKQTPHLVLHVVRIWPERRDGPWLYAEQALADAPDQPYRQRLHRIAPGSDGGIELQTFALPDPIAATGAWRQPALLAALGRNPPAADRSACTLHLREMPDGSFVGATRGQGCPSDLRGAAYATSELTAATDGLIVWDRGFAASGRQVWGPTAGGHRFKRRAASP